VNIDQEVSYIPVNDISQALKMVFPDDIFSRLTKRLKGTLPGEQAQQRLSRYKGYSLSTLLESNPGYKKSAVMVILWPEGDSFRCLLIQRPQYEGFHSGQIALPGGKSEPSDKDLLDTAIRETAEEVGIVLTPECVAGALSPLYIPVSNFLVQPYVSCLPVRPQLQLNVSEVQACIDFDLALIQKEGAIHFRDFRLPDGTQAETPYYSIEGFEVWGATAMILSELSVIVREVSVS
jgi:8-oxo-dGTP pyrophosphatase MutT (NUDIX family)